jgi:hypothetical protein
MLLSDPGDGALSTGYLSPSRNKDPTARNQARLMDEAGLDDDLCVFWNGITWDLSGGKPTAADKARGAAYVREMIELLPKLHAVVAAGRPSGNSRLRAEHEMQFRSRSELRLEVPRGRDGAHCAPLSFSRFARR